MKKIYYFAALVLAAYQINAQTYCTPAFSSGCDGGDQINSFTIPSVSFSHLNTGCSTGAYGDFYATETITLQAGVPYAYNITHDFSSQKVKIWVDFNNDGTFDDAAPELVSSASSSGSETNATIVIPGSVTPGTYRMRVGDRYASDPIPCNTNGYGEAHDYKLVVNAAPSCISPTGVVNTNITATSVDMAWTAAATAPANGYEIYYDTSNTPPTASSTPNLTSITGTSQTVSGLQPSTQYYLWIRSNCSSSDQSLWNYGGTITTQTFCPTVTAPVNGANGQSTTPTISWNAVNGATGYTLTVGSSPGASDVMGGVDLGNVTSYTFSTALPNSTTYYYTVNAYNATVTSNSCTERTFTTSCNPYTIPYFEGFENGYTDNTPAYMCLSQEGVTGNQEWRANSTATDYNRTPRTGSWNAFLRFANERWIFIPVQLNAGVAYKASVYARQDGATASEANITIAYGTSASGAAMTNVIAPSTGIVNGDYQKVSGAFTPTASGIYYVGIKGGISFDPYYLSIDDISIDLAGSCGEPFAVNFSGHTSNSANLSWTAAPTAPSNGYDVYYSTSNVAPDANSAPNLLSINSTSTTLTGLSPNTTYYAWVRSNCGSEKSSWEGAATVFTGYCQPTATPDEFFMGSVTTTGGTTNLNYSNTTALGYDNQSASTVTSTAGSTINMLMNANDVNDTYSYSAWIDWNNDLIFDDATERVYGTDPAVAYETSAVANITIPTTQAPGSYRMRTGVSWDGMMDACGPEANGNYVDFTLVVAGTQATAEASAKDHVKLYPNPFVDVLKISDIKNLQNVEVTDISGRLVKTIKNPSNELQLGDLKSGLYIVTLHYKEGQSKSYKVMKK